MGPPRRGPYAGNSAPARAPAAGRRTCQLTGRSHSDGQCGEATGAASRPQQEKLARARTLVESGREGKMPCPPPPRRAAKRRFAQVRLRRTTSGAPAMVDGTALIDHSAPALRRLAARHVTLLQLFMALAAEPVASGAPEKVAKTIIDLLSIEAHRPLYLLQPGQDPVPLPHDGPPLPLQRGEGRRVYNPGLGSPPVRGEQELPPGVLPGRGNSLERPHLWASLAVSVRDAQELFGWTIPGAPARVGGHASLRAVTSASQADLLAALNGQPVYKKSGKSWPGQLSGLCAELWRQASLLQRQFPGVEESDVVDAVHKHWRGVSRIENRDTMHKYIDKGRRAAEKGATGRDRLSRMR